MKTIVCLLTMLCIFSCAHSEPSDVEISYLYYASGSYVVSVKNLSTCNTQVRLSWRKAGNQDTVVSVAQLSTVIIHLPAAYDAGADIKAKSEGTCPNNGWTRAVVPLTLDVKVIAFNASRKGSGSTVTITYTLSFSEPGDYSVIEKSMTGASGWMPIAQIRDINNRSYTDRETEVCYYRLHNRSVGGGDSYSRIVSVGASYHEVQLAGRISIYDTDGRYLGQLSRWDLLPHGRRLVLTDGTRSQVVAVLN